MNSNQSDGWIFVDRHSHLCARKKNVQRLPTPPITTPTSLEPHQYISRLLKRFQERREDLKVSSFYRSLMKQLFLVTDQITTECCAHQSAFNDRLDHVFTRNGFSTTQTMPHNFQTSSVFCCYGLGSMQNEASLTQLCLASLLREALQIPFERTWVSDPIMDSTDHKIVLHAQLCPHTSNGCREQLGQDVLKPETAQLPIFTDQDPNNEFCVTLPQSLHEFLQNCYHTKIHPLIYLLMPHCDQPIYGEVLRLLESFSIKDVEQQDHHDCPWGIKHCILMGNDLRQYTDLQESFFWRNDGSKTKIYKRALKTLKTYRQYSISKGAVEEFSLCPNAFNSFFINLFKKNP